MAGIFGIALRGYGMLKKGKKVSMILLNLLNLMFQKQKQKNLKVN